MYFFQICFVTVLLWSVNSTWENLALCLFVCLLDWEYGKYTHLSEYAFAIVPCLAVSDARIQTISTVCKGLFLCPGCL